MSSFNTDLEETQKDNLLTEKTSYKQEFTKLFKLVRRNIWKLLTVISGIAIIVLSLFSRIVFLTLSSLLLAFSLVMLIKRCHENYREFFVPQEEENEMREQVSNVVLSENIDEEEDERGIGEENLRVLEAPTLTAPSPLSHSFHNLLFTISALNEIRFSEANPRHSPRERRESLTKRQIKRLPSFSFSNASTRENEDCPICYGTYEDGDKVRTLPCVHSFHSKCVDEWLLYKANCPVCKGKVEII